MKRGFAVVAVFSLVLLMSFVFAASGPVAYYPFDGNSNDLVGGNDGTDNNINFVKMRLLFLLG